MKKAVIIGVGAVDGLGAALAEKFSKNGLEVFISGRTQSKLDKVSDYLRKKNYKVHSILADTTKIEDLNNMFNQVGEGLDLAIYNVGNNMPGKIIDMEEKYFKECWEQCCFGGFLFSKLVINRFISEQTSGTILFTGASASLRGKSNFGAFNSGKGALRNFCQALAKECQEFNIHVAHIIIDGGLNGERIKTRIPNYEDIFGKGGLISLSQVTDAYEFLYKQKNNGWTFELDLRTHKENW